MSFSRRAPEHAAEHRAAEPGRYVLELLRA